MKRSRIREPFALIRSRFKGRRERGFSHGSGTRLRCYVCATCLRLSTWSWFDFDTPRESVVSSPGRKWSFHSTGLTNYEKLPFVVLLLCLNVQSNVGCFVFLPFPFYSFFLLRFLCEIWSMSYQLFCFFFWISRWIFMRREEVISKELEVRCDMEIRCRVCCMKFCLAYCFFYLEYWFS